MSRVAIIFVNKSGRPKIKILIFGDSLARFFTICDVTSPASTKPAADCNEVKTFDNTHGAYIVTQGTNHAEQQCQFDNTTLLEHDPCSPHHNPITDDILSHY